MENKPQTLPALPNNQVFGAVSAQGYSLYALEKFYNIVFSPFK